MAPGATSWRVLGPCEVQKTGGAQLWRESFSAAHQEFPSYSLFPVFHFFVRVCIYALMYTGGLQKIHREHLL